MRSCFEISKRNYNHHNSWRSLIKAWIFVMINYHILRGLGVDFCELDKEHYNLGCLLSAAWIIKFPFFNVFCNMLELHEWVAATVRQAALRKKTKSMPSLVQPLAAGNVMWNQTSSSETYKMETEILLQTTEVTIKTNWSLMTSPLNSLNKPH